MKHFRSAVAWERYGRKGVAQVELLPIGKQAFISMRRLSGERPPAVLLGHILREALGLAFSQQGEGQVRLRVLRGGRVSVRCKGERRAVRVTARNGVENFFLPADALAAMLGQKGLGILFAVDAPLLAGWESVRRV